jgi:hypothetical protein
MVQNNWEQQNNAVMARTQALHNYCVNVQAQQVDPPAMVATAIQLPSPAPYNINAMQNSGKQQHESTAFNDALLDILEKVKRVEKDVKELRADKESRSVTINSTSELPTLPVIPTPLKVLSQPSLAWVPSPPSPAPTPLVLPPTSCLPCCSSRP